MEMQGKKSDLCVYEDFFTHRVRFGLRIEIHSDDQYGFPSFDKCCDRRD